MIDYNHLFELHDLALKDVERYPKKRGLYHHLMEEKGRHFTGISGPRGVGKTVILKQIAADTPDSFYLSADSIEDEDLFEIVKILSGTYGIRLVLLDEIHYQQDYEKKLKKIYDFLDIRVIFSSSVSLSMIETSYDLSRRVRLAYLYPFTFREYIFFKKDVSLPALTLDNILNREWTAEHMRFAYLFEDYLKGELMPFSLEEPQILPLLENIIQKILKKDIPTFAKMRVDEIHYLEKILKFIGRSNVEGINYSSISQNIGITKYKAESYIDLLKKTFLLHVVFPYGTNVLKEPKVLMHLPYRLLYKNYKEAIGAIREDFAAEVLETKSMEYYYLKTTRGAKTPDFLVRQDSGEMVIEIGGKGKGREQFKGVNVEQKLILSHSTEISGLKRPLFLLGYI